MEIKVKESKREVVLSRNAVLICVCLCVEELRWTVGSAEGEGGKEGLWWSIEERQIWVRLDRCCFYLQEEIQKIIQCGLKTPAPPTNKHTHTHTLFKHIHNFNEVSKRR